MFNITIANIKTIRQQTFPKESKFYKIDRTSPVGNPFYMKNENYRAEVCAKYDKYFYETLLRIPSAKDYLEQILTDLRNGLPVVLLCWCAPKQCHGSTIKRYLQNRLKEVSSNEVQVV